MGVPIPAHLLAVCELAFVRPAVGGLSGWRQAVAAAAEPYWQGQGYVSLALKSKTDLLSSSGVEAANLTGVVFFYYENDSVDMFPLASDLLLLDGVAAEVISLRPRNQLIDFWKAEVRTGGV